MVRNTGARDGRRRHRRHAFVSPRRTQKLQYPLAALGMSALLLVWHFAPDQRFVFPLYPLLLAGLWTELANVWQALRRRLDKTCLPENDRGGFRRCGSVGLPWRCSSRSPPSTGCSTSCRICFASIATDFRSRQPAYQWIAQQYAADANVYAYDDPMLYLYTGHKSCSLPIPPKLFYHGDDAGIDQLLAFHARFRARTATRATCC